MSSTPKLNLLILGSSEIARLIVQLAQYADYTITVCDNQVDQHTWPDKVNHRPLNFSEHPWSLEENTHALIARGHEGDAENLMSLLQHRVTHVYLIASAFRAQKIIDQIKPVLPDPILPDKLSAPAGLNLGGQSSYEIAQSILAEIQWRNNKQSSPSILPLTDLRRERINKSITGQRNKSCPGKRT